MGSASKFIRRVCGLIVALGIICLSVTPSFAAITYLKKFNSDTGRGDWVVDVTGSGLLTDAPSDGNTYGRKNGAWAVPSGAAHDAVSLAASATPILSLSTQELSFDVQNANKVLAGPATGADAAPTFRSLVAGDIPDISATYQPKDADLTSIAGGVTGIVKGLGNGNGFSAASDGTDFLAPSRIDDTKGNGDTGYVYSADKVYDLLALKLDLGGGTWTGNMTFGENTALILDSALSADGKYCGVVEAGTAGATLAFGDLVYLNNDDSRWELADANLSDGYDKKLGICVLAAAADGDATTVLLWGKVRADTAFPSLTIGAPVYMSETAGDITTTAPTTTDSATRVVGYGNTADELFFCPSKDYYTHT